MTATHRHLESDIRRLLNQCVADGVAPAASCAVVLGLDWLPEIAAGAASPETYFDLASVTKLFTTVTALSLVDSGELELDAAIGGRLPAYRRGAKSAVTLRHLLTHTSGLPSQWRGWERSLDEGRAFDRQALVADLLDTPLEAAPVTRFEYSCAGFNTIMALAEHVTGTPWAALVQERVLGRLATDRITGTPRVEHCAPTEFQPSLGRGLVRGIVHDEAAWSLGGLSGNAGMFATAGGLRVFGAALLDGLPGILSPASPRRCGAASCPTCWATISTPPIPDLGTDWGCASTSSPGWARQAAKPVGTAGSPAPPCSSTGSTASPSPC